MLTLISFGRGHVPVEGFHCNPGTSLNFNPGDVRGGGEWLRERGNGKLCIPMNSNPVMLKAEPYNIIQEYNCRSS